MATAARVPLIIPSEGAKVLIVKFNDFQCPACDQSYLQYKSIFAKYEAQAPGAVKLVLKDYPLNSNCNVNVGTVMHAGSCDAAVAVRLADFGVASTIRKSNARALTAPTLVGDSAEPFVGTVPHHP